MKSFLSRILGAIALVTAFVSIPGPLSWGDLEPYRVSQSQTNCAMAPNPNECYQQQKGQLWSSTDALNYFTNRNLVQYGPFGAMVKYDNDLSWIFGLSYLQMLHDVFGIALKASFGENEGRANITAGLKVSEKQQVKLTYEYLRQNLPFDFFSGTQSSWVFQNSLGGAYQYLLRKSIIHSLELSGHYISANNKMLPEATYVLGNDTFYNLRRIAGGKEKTVQAVVNFLPFRNTTLALGGGYSTVNYDTLFENGQDVNTFAYKAELAHIPLPTVKVAAGVNNNASNTDTNLTISKLVKGFEVAVTGQYTQGRGNILDSKNVLVGINYPAPKDYRISKDDLISEFKNWIEKPVIYSSRVLAVKDESVIKYAITVAQPIPNQTINEGQPIAPVNTTDYFKFDPTIYDKVDYTFSIVSMTTNTAPPDNLNLAIAPNGPYEATLYSASGTPYQTSDQYQVTIIATGTKTGLKNSEPVTVTESASFELDILPLGPQWTSKLLPDAPMGQAYPDNDLNNGYVTSEIPDDTYTFEILNGPDWVKLKDDHHTLTAVEGKLVPQTANLPPITLKVSNSSAQVSQKNFNFAVDQSLPIWNGGADYQNWAIDYDDTTNGILLNPYIVNGLSNLSFSFPGNQSISGNWKVEQQGGNYYLRRTTASSPLPDDVGSRVELKLVGHNSTSTPDNQEQNAVQIVNVKVNQAQDVPAPVWKNTQLTANAGDTSYTVSLPPLVQDSVNNDRFTFTLTHTSGDSQWLKLSPDGQSLIVDGSVPPVGTGANGQVQFQLNAISAASNKPTGDTTFTLTVTNFAPVWDSNLADKATIPFDATEASGQPGILLNNLISQNTSNLNFAFSSDGQSKVSGNWVIVQNGSNYALKRVQADLSDVDTSVPVTIFALNSTSNGGVSYKIPVYVTGDASLPPPAWTGNNPVQVLAGTAAGGYSYDLNGLFTCPSADTCSIKVDLQNTASWLEVQTSKASHQATATLVNTATVPTASTDPSGLSLPFHVTISGLASGHVIEQDFSIPIKNVLPNWQDPGKGVPEVIFDGNSPGIDLSTYITTDTPAGMNGLKFSPGPGFDSTKWVIQGNTLQRLTTAGSDDISDTPVVVSIHASNDTSVNGAESVDKSLVKVKVIADGTLNPPSWTGTIDDAQMGYPYLYPNASLDLSSIVTPSTPSDQLTYELLEHPNWLDMQPCTVSGKATYCLVPVGNVPTSAGDNFSVHLRVTSKASGKPAEITYNKGISKVFPGWIELPTGTLEFADTTTGISLNQYITTGQGNSNGDKPVLRFELQYPSDSDKWKIEAQGDQYYLYMTSNNPGYTDPNTIGGTLGVSVLAYNNTSDSGKPAEVNVKIVQNPNLPGPGFNGDPADIQAGSAPDTYSYSLKKLVSCPNNDVCTIEANVSGVSWLTATPNADNTDLVISNNAVVPAADQDPSGPSPAFHVKVTSHNSGNVVEKDFTITINNVFPLWTTSPPPVQDLYFDGNSSDDKKIRLEDFIDSGKTGLSFEPGANFDGNQWQIVADSDGYHYLRRKPGASAVDIGSVDVNILAKNTTSQNGQGGTITVNVIADPNLGPPVLKGDIIDVDMGYPYQSVDLNTVFGSSGTVNGDSLTFSLNSGAPDWLQIQPCTGTNGQPSTCLTGNGKNVPVSDDKTFTVSIHVESKASGSTQPLDQSLTKNINQALPGWVTSPEGSIQFNSTDSGIELDTLIDKNTGNPNGDTPILDFKVDPAFAKDWEIRDNGGKPYLYMTATNLALGNIDYLNGDLKLTDPKVIAVNNTSSPEGVSADIKINLLPDSSKPVPGWNANNPADTQAQVQNYGIKLCKLIDSGNCSDDQYKFTVAGLQGTDIADPTQWLLADADTQNLTANTVPTAAVDPTAADPENAGIVNFELIAQSRSTGEFSIPKVFSFKVSNILPACQGVEPPPKIIYNGKNSESIDLNAYVGDGKLGLAFAPGPNFRTDEWEITDNILKRIGGNPNEIGPVWTVNVLATNITSANGAVCPVLVQYVEDATLVSNWNNQPIVDAYMGFTYGDDSKTGVVNLSALISTPDEPLDTFTFYFDDTVVPAPDWLDVQTEGGLLVSKNGAVVPQSAQPFNLAVYAISHASGNLIPYVFNNQGATKVDVIQTPAVWTTTPAVPYGQWQMPYDDTSKGYELDPYISEGNLNLKFDFADSQGHDNWTIVQDTDNHYYLRRTTTGVDLPSDLNVPVTFDIVASNSTSTVAVKQTVTVTAIADASLTPGWSSNPIPDARMGYPYRDYSVDVNNGTAVDLNGMISTKDKDGNLVKDTYTFTISDITDPDKNGWLQVDANGHLISAGGESTNIPVPQSAVGFDVTIIATSTVSGNSVPITFNGVKVIEVPVVWQNVTNSQVIFNDTATSLPTDTDGKPITAGLTTFIQSGTDKGINFAIDPSDPAQCASNFTAGNWVSPTAANPNYIFRSTSADASDVGQEVANIPVTAENITSATPVSTCIPVQVLPNPNWSAPRWSATTLPPLQGGESGLYKYTVESGNNPRLGDLISDPDPDSPDSGNPIYNRAFNCTFTSTGKTADGNEIPFVMAADSEGDKQNLTNNPSVNGGGMPPVDDAVSVTINCTSNASGLSTGDRTFNLSVPPVLAQSYPNQLRFDDITTGLNLRDMFISGRKNITFTYNSNATTGYIPANWTINNGYLRRALIGTAPNQQIDASELATNGPILGNAHVQFDVSNDTIIPTGTTINTVIPVELQADPALEFSYSRMSPVIQPAVEPQDTTVLNWPALDTSTILETMPQVSGGYAVVNDSAMQFFDPDPGKQPGFINFTKIDSGQITFTYPTLNYLSADNIPWFVGVKSVANGNTNATITMPPFSVTSLIIVPPAPPSGSTPVKIGNITLGHDRLSQGDSTCAALNLTYLNLSGLKAGRYLLTQVSNSIDYIADKYPPNLRGVPRPQVCKGTINAVLKYPTKCSNDPNGPDDSQSLTTGTLIDTDGNGAVSFLPSINCLDANTYPIIKNGEVNAKDANIILSIPPSK